jgi:uncharacterized membrane protein YfcA
MDLFSTTEIFLICLLFIWTGFVRAGLGFGGSALGLPLMLMLLDDPVFWLPIICVHLLFFSALTLGKRLKEVEWAYLKKSLVIIIPTTLVGIFGLLNLPNTIVVIFIYSITLFYAITWIFNYQIKSESSWVDRILLALGGYVAGTSLTGAPLMVAVYMKHVRKEYLRNTLFVLWFILVSMKMTTFVVLGVDLHLNFAILLLPVAAIGHFIGLKAHDLIIQNDKIFKQVVGVLLAIVCIISLLRI